MEVETVGEQSLSVTRSAAYLCITVAFVGIALAPTLLSWTCLRALKTVVLLLILAQIGRLVLSSVLSVSEPADTRNNRSPCGRGGASASAGPAAGYR